MLAIAAAIRQAGITTACDLVFAGNVGEEGDGDLRGMRHIYRAEAMEKSAIAAHIVLDGAGHESAVTHALGSQRHLVTITGPGGHSWTDCAAEPRDPAIFDGDASGYSADDDECGDD